MPAWSTVGQAKPLVVPPISPMSVYPDPSGIPWLVDVYDAEGTCVGFLASDRRDCLFFSDCFTEVTSFFVGPKENFLKSLQDAIDFGATTTALLLDGKATLRIDSGYGYKVEVPVALCKGNVRHFVMPPF